MGSKGERYCNLYRLTNTKTGEIFEGRKWLNVLKKAGLKTAYNASTMQKTKKWKVEIIEESLPWDEAAYRKELYVQTKARCPEYEKKKEKRDPLYEKRKRLKTKKWKNPDGTLFTAEQHETMLKQVCAVCRSKENIVVDHNHSTNIVRGSLCRTCNLALGFVQDNPQILMNLISYLEERNY